MILNGTLKLLFEWSVNWKLQFNAKKGYVMLISNKGNILEFHNCLGESMINRISKFTDLGIIKGNNLSWKPHIRDYIKTKAMKNL